MRKVVAIQQPEHLPWLGFFDKMRKCDLYIFLDNVQFKKRYFENRNKIRTPQGFQWLTVPVITKGRYLQNINEVELDNSQDWRKKYLGSMRHSYSKSPLFERVYSELEEIINSDCGLLVELNLKLIHFFKDFLKIKTETLKASEIVNGFKGSELILELCKRTGAKEYISGPDGRNYLMLNEFEKASVEVSYHDYKHPVYRQMHGEFISHMSTLDYIFNEGMRPI